MQLTKRGGDLSACIPPLVGLRGRSPSRKSGGGGRPSSAAALLASHQPLTRCTALERTFPPNVKVPHADKAEVPERKIRRYLLDPAHSAGGSKARFFHEFGFAAEPWEHMARQLRRHVAENEVMIVRQKEHGISYAVDGPLDAPDGSRLQVRSVWFIETHREIPRFVTAHPLPKS